MKTFKFRLYPTKRQSKLLNSQLETCRKVYNKCLEYKKEEYLNKKRHVSEFDLNSKICEWRNTSEPWMQNTGVAFLHEVSRRVDKAFKGFFRRVKEKNGKAGYPRFKQEKRYNSMTNPRFNYKIKNSKIKLTNDLGLVKIVAHREFPKKPTGYTLSKNSCNQWYISIFFETNKVPNKAIDESKNVGIDMGCSNLVTYSDGGAETSPKFFKNAENELRKSNKKNKKNVSAKIYKKVSNRRLDFLHKLSNKIVKKYDLIFIEDLNLKKLGEKSYKNIRKSLRDGSFGIFSTLLSYKAEDAGKILRKVNPAYTSQECSSCGKIKEKSLSERTHKCDCGYTEDRDVNAARNILRRGLASLAQA